MKLVKRTAKSYVFMLGKKECALFRKLLKLYPVVDVPYQVLSKTADPEQIKADQKLLEEAIGAQKQENKRQILALLKNQNLFKKTARGYRLKLDASHRECFLQVLNEIRVGSWRKLGSPDQKSGKPIVVNEDTVPYLWAMVLSEQFEFIILRAGGL